MTTKHYLLGTAAALAIASIASLASVASPIEGTLLAPRVAASTTKLPTPLDRAPKCAPQLAVLEPLTDDIKSAQRQIVKKTMLASATPGGGGGAKYPVDWSKANLPSPALGGSTVV